MLKTVFFSRQMSVHHIASKYLMGGVLTVFVVALVIHGHQTEATYRLDFLWKLQVVSSSLGFFSGIAIFEYVSHETLNLPIDCVSGY